MSKLPLKAQSANTAVVARRAISKTERILFMFNLHFLIEFVHIVFLPCVHVWKSKIKDMFVESRKMNYMKIMFGN